jgi:hypothetical protein
MEDTPSKEDKQQQTSDHAMQPRCIDMPNDEPEGHYWSWVTAPRSVPNQYRECMICGRIDATEWLASRKNPLKEDLKVVGGEDEDLLRSLNGVRSDRGMLPTGTWSFDPDKLVGFIKSRDQRIALEARKKGVRDGLNYALTDIDLAISYEDAWKRVSDSHKKSVEACND